jgi:ABC-type lipoprotein export system ATPase subunit
MRIQVRHLHKTYRNALGGTAREVLRGLSLDVAAGETLALMGPSGSGKTTLLNLLGSLDRPDSGTIRVGEESLTDMTASQVLEYRSRRVGFVFQMHHLLPQCSLLENVLLPVLPLKGEMAAARERARELLHQMGVWEQRHHKPGELSGGECQRAAVARALINQPGLLLADEPTGSLDEENAARLMELLMGAHRDRGITLILATHAESIASRMNRVCLLRQGVLAERTGGDKRP